MKRGQATVFVILGLVILTIIGTAYTFRSQLLESLIGRETGSAIAVPPQAEKVKVLVESCIQQVGEDALGMLGVQGGYIDLPAAKIPASPMYPFTNTFDLFGNAGVAIPFWYFEDARGSEQTQVPTTEQMEQELAAYIDTFLPTCFNNFQSLQQQGYRISSEQPQTTVKIGEKTVAITTDLPLDMTVDDFQFSFTTFKKNIPSSITELYTVAKEIMNYENNNYFLEDRMLDMMVVYEEIPFSGVDFTCSPKSWTKTDVYQDMKKIIARNLPQLRVKGTSSIQGNEPPSYIIDALNRRYQGAVDFSFQESWPLLMEVIGENGEILRGKPFTTENELSRFLLPLFCLNDYHFVYNLKFPVKVTVTKENELFQFATLVTIQNNQPRENRADLEAGTSETQICDYPNQDMKMIVEGYGKNGFVQPLNNAQVAFKCINQVCDLGSTRLEQNNYALTKKVPSCVNGLLSAEKEGFHRAEQTISTNTGYQEVTLTLEPVHELMVDLIINDEGTERAPYPSEQILFMFDNKAQKYGTSLIYPAQKTVKLIAGAYEITASILIENENGFSLQEKEIEICNNVPQSGVLGIAGLTKRQCTKQKIEGITLDQLPVGTSSVQWFADRESLLNAQKIQLYAWRGKTPQSVEELGQFSQKIEAKEVKSPVLQ